MLHNHARVRIPDECAPAREYTYGMYYECTTTRTHMLAMELALYWIRARVRVCGMYICAYIYACAHGHACACGGMYICALYTRVRTRTRSTHI